MPDIRLPYGKAKILCRIPEKNFAGTMTASLHDSQPDKGQEELVREAMTHPLGAPRLSRLAMGKRTVVILASDHTRPVPSRTLLPLVLQEIREGNPQADITILIATGCHRATSREELAAKLGPDIVEQEKIVVHDCDDHHQLVSIGVLPSGGECWINRLAVEADLLVAEGFIEPHFFAGFSGGRKSVLPGIAGRKTVLSNHCSEFIAHEKARTGILEGNPIHEDMLWAARQAGLAYIVNVVINAEKKIVYAAAGDVEEAHRAGREFLSSRCRVRAIPADIVISTNGGYPLDQNIYQAVKGLTAAEAAVREGGVIIMLSRSEDGAGGEAFYHQLADEPDIEKTLSLFMSRGRAETAPDQWQTQILIRVLRRARVIYFSDAPDPVVRSLHMLPVHSMEEALALARELIGKEAPSIAVIPDGVSVIVSAGD
ncbi:MAG: nickel-dependent lactate racemase [Clostridiales bacterium]|nr:nickel-dependent lactate racemase [Clostridiales bacterium]